MRWFISSLLCLTFFSLAPAFPQEWKAQSEEEALFLRRIADFWKEGEYAIVKSQIEEFLREYPESSFSETLHGTLGDLYVRDGNFKGALMQYALIQEPIIADKIFLNRMQCLLELQWFATLADECEAYLQQEPISSENKQRATHLLAISLYQQCLNASDDPALLEKLAERALPYFQELLKGRLSDEIAQASAYLSTILKNYSDAAEIYLQLAESSGSDQEEMLFQAALFQAQYDKFLALNTFERIANAHRSRESEAAYNSLVLAYTCEKYEELISKKEALLVQMPPEKENDARLFFGKTYLQLKNYPEALRELLGFIENAKPSEILRSALLDLLNVANHLEDMVSLAIAVDRLAELFPDEAQLPKGYLCKALLHKKKSQYECARSLFVLIRSKFPETGECQSALFEQIHLDFHESRWEECRALCQSYLSRYADSDRASYVWRFFGAASSNFSAKVLTEPARQQLCSDIELLLSQKRLLSKEEQSEWIFLLAKTQYDLHWYKKAIATLDFLLSEEPEHANAHLILALSYRDGFGDGKKFCEKGELALTLGADLLDAPSIHVALFNEYLERELHDLAAEHLHEASLELTISGENLLWLADYYDKKSLERPKNEVYSQKALSALEKFIDASGISPEKLEMESLVFEKALVKLAELYGQTGKNEKQLSLLESLKQQQESHPSWPWQEESAIELQLAEKYEKMGRKERALSLYDKLAAKSVTLRNFSSAAAALKGSRLRLEKLDSLSKEELFHVMTLLKTLSLQKNLINEPIHLEAALEYIDLQTELEESDLRMQKRLALLIQTKKDFEEREDLLSRDYHAGRGQLPEKEILYRGYLRLFQAEIFFCQSFFSEDEFERTLLLQNAKKLYEEILENPPTDYLVNRAERQLELLAK